MTDLQIGSAAGTPIFLNLEKLVETRLLLQANSGGGKSETLRNIVEKSYGKIQIIILDTEGEFSSLREVCPDFLLVGADGDVPINIKMAGLLPQKLMELGVSTILDLSELQAHERILFVKRFCDSMIGLPKELWIPVLVVIDEIHLYCPQNGSVESSNSVINIATRGRKRQQALIGATQRLSKLHKDVAAECNNKVIGRTNLDNDQKRVGEELGFTKKEEIRDLRNLEPGEFYVYGPAVTRQVTKMQMTRAKSKKPPVGSALAKVKTATPNKIKSMIEKLASLPLEAAQHDLTIAELKKENTELKRRLGQQKMPDIAGFKAAQEKIFAERIAQQQQRMIALQEKQKKQDLAALDKDIKFLEQQLFKLKTFEPLIQQALKGFDTFKDHVKQKHPETAMIEEMLDSKQQNTEFWKDLSKVPYNEWKATAKNMAVLTDGPIMKSKSADLIILDEKGDILEGAFKISIPQRKILICLQRLSSCHIDPVARPLLAVMSGQSPTSSGFSKNLSTLRTMGFIDYQEGSTVSITLAGRKEAPDFEPILDDSELQSCWKGMLSVPQWNILQILIKHYPDALQRSSVAEESGQSLTSSGYAKNLSTLKTLGAIEYAPNSCIKASRHCFLEDV